MAEKLRSNKTGTVYTLPLNFGGGVIAYTTGNYNPIVTFPNSAEIIGDTISMKIPYSVSNEYYFVADDGVTPLDSTYSPLYGENVTLQPNCTADPGLVSLTPIRSYDASFNTVFHLNFANSGIYQMQFVTNIVGVLDSGGYPTINGWEDIAKTNGVFKVPTISIDILTPQTIYFRWKGCTNYFPKVDLTPLPLTQGGSGGTGSGGGGTGTNPSINAIAALNGVPLLAHVWGMFGNDNRAAYITQGTYQSDVYAIQQLFAGHGDGAVPESGGNPVKSLSRLPWFTTTLNTPESWSDIQTWSAGVEQAGKQTQNLNYKFLMTTEVLDQMLEFAVQAGLQGFMTLNYKNDGYLSLFKRLFRVHPNKRGLKNCYSLDTIADCSGRSTYGDVGENLNSEYRQQINDFAYDMMQTWYATARKNGTARPIVYLLIENAGNHADKVSAALLDLTRIKDRMTVLGASSTETFNILMSSGIDLPALGYTFSADAVGNAWNAKSDYYKYGDGSFSENIARLETELDFANNTSVANKSPMVSWGLDQDARWLFQKQDITGNKYPIADVLTHLPTMLDRLKTTMNNNSKDLRVVLCGQVGEYAEQGRDLFPNIYGWRGYLNIFHNKFNSTYPIPQ